MLREADSIGVQEAVLVPAYASARPAVSAGHAVAVALPGSRYGEGKKFSPFAITLTIALHVALIAAMFLIRNHFVHKREAKLTVMNLTPAPPPPAATPEQPQTKPVIVTPRPIVDIQRPAPVTMETTPDPTPQPVVLPPAPATAVSTPPAPPSPPSIVQASDLGNRMVSGKPPRYPFESRKKHEQGTVVLMLILGVDGRVASISVNQSSGSPALDDAALDAVRKWRWEPITRNGQAVMVKGLVEIPFVLRT